MCELYEQDQKKRERRERLIRAYTELIIVVSTCIFVVVFVFLFGKYPSEVGALTLSWLVTYFLVSYFW